MQSSDNPDMNPHGADEPLSDTGAVSESEAPGAGTSKSNEPTASETGADIPAMKKKKGSHGLGTTRGIETMFRTSYRVHMELSSIADAKANIMISINGLIISIIIASISPKIDTNPWLLIPTTVMLLGCLVSIVYAVLSARPRVSSDLISLDDVRSNRANILFFGHFSRLSEDDFVTAMSELLSNSTTLYQNMIRDIYGLGKVLTRKFELLRVSYTAFMFGLVCGILLFIFVYVWVVVSLNSDPNSLAETVGMFELLTHGGAA